MYKGQVHVKSVPATGEVWKSREGLIGRCRHLTIVLKLDIRGRTVSRHLESVSPDSSSFQSITLGGKLIHGDSMQTIQPVTSISQGYCAYSSTLFPERDSLLLPHLWFSFMRKTRSPLPIILFQFYNLVRRMETKPDENPNISTTLHKFSLHFGIDDGF
ncbi:hypothetical protein AVEN_110995-1 [Araneus ventricosus]|uniref:Uncharacterized protein n=1 Tax=Araneus ventricosus TaxID=182803 RepID=A0A4Y2HNW4_ARAVE|nr:hypothetical protein AVEN_110995-1 [Araneus ventricosus]